MEFWKWGGFSLFEDILFPDREMNISAESQNRKMTNSIVQLREQRVNRGPQARPLTHPVYGIAHITSGLIASKSYILLTLNIVFFSMTLECRDVTN